MPGIYIIAYFVSDALNFSIFDHDIFAPCDQAIAFDIPYTSTYKRKKKRSCLKLQAS